MAVVHGPPIGARIPRSAAGTGSPLAWMTVLSMTAVSAFSGTACGRDARGSTARGAGASLSAPLVSRWADAYPGPGRVDYRAVGSGGAVHMLEIGTVDFGVRDAGEGEGSRDDTTANANKPVLEIPIAHAAVVVAMNLADVTDLRLGKATLAALFSGEIERWNDPRIAHENPGQALPDLPILPVHRTDASGTLRVFTGYVAAASPEFAASVGIGESPRFPTGVRAYGTGGVALALKSTRGSVGVLELGIARASGLLVASLEGAPGTFVAPSPVRPVRPVRAVNADRTVVSARSVSYPLVSTVYALVPRDGPRGEPRRVVVSFLRWALSEGQSMLADETRPSTLAFGALDDEERKHARALLDAAFGAAP